MDFEKVYREKVVTPEKIAQQFKSNDICVSNGQIAEPIQILKALANRAKKEKLENIKHYILLPMRQQEYLAKELEGHIRHVSHFVSGFDREAVWEGRAEYMPSHYGRVPHLWKNILPNPDVFYCSVSPMDKHGYFSCGTSGDLNEIRLRAKKILLEVNSTMPRTMGSNIHVSEVDYLIESDEQITVVSPAKISKEDEEIGRLIADEIPDGATIQLGIGAIPNAVAQALQDKKHLGVHSEMFCDSMVDLFYKGVIDNSMKNIHRGKFTVAFTFGTKATYDFLDDNPVVEFLPVDYVNDPRVIAQNDNVISINSCVEVDLFGQVCSESIGPMTISGVGGQMDFVRGAADSKGGKSFLAFKSTAKSNSISKIKPLLTTGSIVSTTRNDVDFIVTEFGKVRLKGMTVQERAKALISIAHPNFREQLEKDAREMHLIF